MSGEFVHETTTTPILTANEDVLDLLREIVETNRLIAESLVHPLVFATQNAPGKDS